MKKSVLFFGLPVLFITAQLYADSFTDFDVSGEGFIFAKDTSGQRHLYRSAQLSLQDDNTVTLSDGVILQGLAVDSSGNASETLENVRFGKVDSIDRFYFDHE